jgi:hypothetical protein
VSRDTHSAVKPPFQPVSQWPIFLTNRLDSAQAILGIGQFLGHRNAAPPCLVSRVVQLGAVQLEKPLSLLRFLLPDIAAERFLTTLWAACYRRPPWTFKKCICSADVSLFGPTKLKSAHGAASSSPT